MLIFIQLILLYPLIKKYLEFMNVTSFEINCMKHTPYKSTFYSTFFIKYPLI